MTPTRTVDKVRIKAFLNCPFQTKSIDKNESDISITKLGRYVTWSKKKQNVIPGKTKVTTLKTNKYKALTLKIDDSCA
ncbi:hypothetical protein LEP1GSC060_0195 [Leptospira weilii serovar Ranarum str. ICFT]|uniref:Uncharacterized protein n=1 Tax=Leptospira weilii serovar Ranarum str. ICFT TaxID=1218598 RepID=N1WRL0_9LEPT|nr:hypothetical protein LEP1GSC060_0195 [Leptospira weilii serovar Ranarum str. ICFT]